MGHAYKLKSSKRRPNRSISTRSRRDDTSSVWFSTADVYSAANVYFISSKSKFMMQTIWAKISLCSLEGKPVICLAVPEKLWSRSSQIEPGRFVCLAGWIRPSHTVPKRNWQASGGMDDSQELQTDANKWWMRGEWRYDNLITFTQHFTLHYELMEEEENTWQSIKTVIYSLKWGRPSSLYLASPGFLCWNAA